MMQLDRVTVDWIKEIFRVYKEICGGHTEHVAPEDVLSYLMDMESEDINVRQRAYAWLHGAMVFGSRFNMNSKLKFLVDRDRKVTPFFYKNFNPWEEKDDNSRWVDACAAKKKFDEAVFALST